MIKHFYIILSLLSVLSFRLSAQIDSTWIKTYGGNRIDKALDIISTPDQGYLLLGTTSSFGLDNAQMYFLKLDSLGNILWSKNYGGLNQEWGHSVINTIDGGYLGVGYTNSRGSGGFDAYLVKLSHDGSYQYERTFGGYNWDFAYDVVQVDTGLFAIAGETKSIGNGNSDAWLFMFNEQTNTFEWQTTVGDSLNDNFKSVILNHNNQLVAAGAFGESDSNGESGFIASFNLNGDLLNDTLFSPKEQLNFNALKQFQNLSYVLTGESSSNDSVYAYTVRLDTSFNLITSDFLTTFKVTRGKDVFERGDGFPAVIGTTDVSSGNSDVFYINMGFNGSGTYNTLGNDVASAITITNDSNYAIIGHSTGSDFNYEQIVLYKSVNGIISNSIIENVTDSANITSVQNTLLDNAIQIRYNNRQIRIENSLTFPIQVKIYNAAGSVLNMYKTSSNSLAIGQNLKPGIYIIEVYFENQRITKKIAVY